MYVFPCSVCMKHLWKGSADAGTPVTSWGSRMEGRCAWGDCCVTSCTPDYDYINVLLISKIKQIRPHYKKIQA